MKNIFICSILFLSFFLFSCEGSYYIVADLQFDTLNTKTFSDTNLSITLSNPMHKCIDIDLTNLSDNFLFLDFDYSTFVDPKSRTYQIISGETQIGKSEDLQRIFVFPSHSNIKGKYYPKELSYWSDKDFIQEPIFRAYNNIGDKCILNIAYRIGDKTSPVSYLKVPLKIKGLSKYYYLVGEYSKYK